MDDNLRIDSGMKFFPMPLNGFACRTMLAITLLAPVVQAQEPQRTTVPVTNPAGLRPGQRGVVVLTSGRVLAGAVSETGGGYRIDYDGTFATVPYEDVKITAPTLADAYLRIHDSMKNPIAGDHLTLCEWCIANGLWNEAQAEVTYALRLEPLRSDAHALVWKIDQHVRSLPSAAPVSATTPVASQNPARPEAGATAPSGLSRELQAEFIRYVQPLLMNKCGNGACHGGTNELEFRLMGNRSSTTSQRLSNEENLNAALAQINFDSPFQSPLITKPGELGPSHRKVFIGSSGNNQRQLLLDWITRVVAEQQAQKPESLPKPLPAEVAASPLTPLNGNPPSLQPVPAAGPVPRNPFSESPVQTAPSASVQQQSLDNSRLREILNRQRPDPFDPEAFNRLVHGNR